MPLSDDNYTIFDGPRPKYVKPRPEETNPSFVQPRISGKPAYRRIKYIVRYRFQGGWQQRVFDDPHQAVAWQRLKQNDPNVDAVARTQELYV